jgi:hypothetical protein
MSDRAKLAGRHATPKPTTVRPRPTDVLDSPHPGGEVPRRIHPEIVAPPGTDDPSLLQQLPPPLHREALQGLQRTHGNAAVQRLIARQAVEIKGEPTVATPTEIGTILLGPGKEATLVALQGKATMYFDPMQINGKAKALPTQLAGLTGREREWRREVAALAAYGGGGADRLEAVEAATPAIGARTRGRSGEYVRTSIEEYLSAIRRADRDLRDIDEKRVAVEIALGKIQTLALEQEKTKAIRHVEQREEDLAKEQERIDRQRERIAGYIGLAAELVEPENWRSMYVAAAVCVASTIAEHAVSTSHLERLRTQLDQAKAKLREIEDAELLSRIETASKELDKARLELANAKENFLALLGEIREKESTVVETLGGSEATKGAAGAIAARGAVTATAMRSESLIATYQTESQAAMRAVAALDEEYRFVVESVRAVPRLTTYGKEHAERLVFFAGHNRQGLARVHLWLHDKGEEARDALEYVGKGDYFKSYADIPAALSAALAGRNAPRGQGGTR